MQSRSTSLFRSSWWRWDLCNRWNPLTIMRAWQLWHFDDADIHIPEHKGEEMKKPLTPPSIPAPPPPQLTTYHRPCLLQLPKYTTPKPTNKQIKSRVNIVSVVDECMNKWRQRWETIRALTEHCIKRYSHESKKHTHYIRLRQKARTLLISFVESFGELKHHQTNQPKCLSSPEKPAKQHQVCWWTSGDQWHTLQ